jgi:hypothetical protein
MMHVGRESYCVCQDDAVHEAPSDVWESDVPEHLRTITNYFSTWDLKVSAVSQSIGQSDVYTDGCTNSNRLSMTCAQLFAVIVLPPANKITLLIKLHFRTDNNETPKIWVAAYVVTTVQQRELASISDAPNVRAASSCAMSIDSRMGMSSLATNGIVTNRVANAMPANLNHHWSQHLHITITRRYETVWAPENHCNIHAVLHQLQPRLPS